MASKEEVTIIKDDLWFYERIGKGGYGYVMRAVDKRNGLDLAVKCFEQSDDSEKLKREAKRMKELQHESIVRIYGFVENDSFAGVAMEYMAGGTVVDAKKSLRNAGKTLPIEIMNQWNYEIAEGIRFIHGKNVVHKDIKARNCLIDAHFHAKLCDFELCRGIQTSTLTQEIMTKPKATPTHMCPQCIRDISNNSEYDTTCDIYAFGILMFEVYSKNTQPFPDRFMEQPALLSRAVDKDNLRPNTNEINRLVPPEIIRLMENCWAEEPKARPGAQEIVQELYKVFKPQQEKAKQDAIILTPHVLRVKTMKEGKQFSQVTQQFSTDGSFRVSNDHKDRVWKHLSAKDAEDILDLGKNHIRLEREQAVVSDDCINAISKQIGPYDFKHIGRCLLFTDPELDGIYHDFERQGIAEINTKMLIKWKEARDNDATYKWLATVCLSIKRDDLIGIISSAAA